MLACVLAGCGFQRGIAAGVGTSDAPGGGAGDGGSGDGGSGDAGSDASAANPGCVPSTWRATHTETFDGTLANWYLDPNASPPTLSWSISSSAMVGHSESSGTDAELVTGDLGDSAVVAHMSETSLASGTGHRVAGPLVRATQIDFANNLYYGCLLDSAAQMVFLARYDATTAVSSGQGWTHLADIGTGAITGTVTVTLCAQGSQLRCEIPELGVTASASDTMYTQGQPGLRVMLADTSIADYTVYEP